MSSVKRQCDWNHPKLGVLVHVGTQFFYNGLPRGGRGPVLDIGEQIGQGFEVLRVYRASDGTRYAYEFKRNDRHEPILRKI